MDALGSFRHKSRNRGARRNPRSTGTQARFESLPFHSLDRPTRWERRRSIHRTHCTERTSHLPFSARLPNADADACRQRCEARLHCWSFNCTDRMHPPRATHERLHLALPRDKPAAGGSPPPSTSLITNSALSTHPHQLLFAGDLLLGFSWQLPDGSGCRTQVRSGREDSNLDGFKPVDPEASFV